MSSLIIVHGPTGAGKSRQANLLAEKHGWVYISSGKELRRHHLAAKVRAVLGAGELVPSAVIEQIMGEALAKVPAGQTIVLDGFPRKLKELEWLEQQIKPQGRRIQRAIELTVPEEVALERVAHRGDGSETQEQAAARIKWYRQDTKQVLARLAERGVVAVVDGVGSWQEVAQRVEAAL